MKETKELYTVKDIAEIIEVSKPTVQKIINDLQIEPVSIEKNKFRLYSVEDTGKIISSIRQDFDFAAYRKATEKPQSDCDKPQNDTDKLPKDTAKTQNDSQMLLLESILTTLQGQLAEKDKQIAAYQEQVSFYAAQVSAKDKQIEEYSQRLKEAMQLTQGQQFIAAADKVERLTAPQQEDTIKISQQPIEPKETQPEKFSIWKKFFKRG